MSDLIRAARVFNFVIPEWCEDDVVVGKIVGVSIHAGEVRRLAKALDDAPQPGQDDLNMLELLRKGRRIEAIKYRRTYSGEGLKEAKDYVDQLGLKHNLLRIENRYGSEIIVSAV
jgi:ribosomal protein L7/L12